MRYILTILIMAILIAIYIGIYYLNSKVDKPIECEEVDCDGCKLNCNKRG